MAVMLKVYQQFIFGRLHVRECDAASCNRICFGTVEIVSPVSARRQGHRYVIGLGIEVSYHHE